MAKEYRHCAACSESHPPHLQNGVLIPVCQKCWKLASINTKLFCLSLTQLQHSVDNIDRSLIDVADSMVAALAATRQRDTTGKSNNN